VHDYLVIYIRITYLTPTMTIDTQWLSCFKSECREAFTEKCRFKPAAVFSDGQIRLMQTGSPGLQTWDDYIYNRFIRYYAQFLKQADTLIIAFDNYQYVPTAKCMTQTSRRKHIPCIPFSSHSPLPCMVPQGEQWIQHISNRAFKMRVIELIILRLPYLLLSKNPSKTIIIDYETPIKYTASTQDHRHFNIEQEALTDYAPLGEADVKFCRWCDEYRNVIVDSIDGDSVPIALMHHEITLNRELIPPRVSIYRMQVKDEDEKTAQRKKAPTTKTKERQPRVYEYLDIYLLYQSLMTCIRQTIGRTECVPSHRGHEVRMIISLITLTGTDFTRHLPQLSARSVWDMLVALWMPLVMSYDPLQSQFKLEPTMHCLITRIYHTKFHKHVRPENGMSYPLTHHDLLHSKISQRTKDSLASQERIQTTIKNCNWVLQYWLCENKPPDPISQQFGYAKTHDNKVNYEDLIDCIM
jgi:hypothetical protein